MRTVVMWIPTERGVTGTTFALQNKARVNLHRQRDNETWSIIMVFFNSSSIIISGVRRSSEDRRMTASAWKQNAHTADVIVRHKIGSNHYIVYNQILTKYTSMNTHIHKINGKLPLLNQQKF